MRAKLLLSMKHGLARLDNVWGVGGGQRPVMYLVNKVVIILCFAVCEEFVIGVGDIENSALQLLQQRYHNYCCEACDTVLEYFTIMSRAQHD